MTLKVWLPAIRANSGTDVFTRRFADALDRAGVRVTTTWFPHWHEFAAGVFADAPPPGTMLVHANSWNAFAYAKRSIPLVATNHLCVLDPAWLQQAGAAQRLYHQLCVRRWEARSFAAADAATAISQSAADSVRRIYGVSCRMIHYWIDTTIFSPGSGSVRGKRPFRLLFVGNLTRRKGADLLPQIARRLGPDFELTCVGLRKTRPGGSWPDNVIHLDPIQSESGMVELYRRSDALLFPTRWEGFGYAPLEALACGRPVIATGVSSLPEVVRHGDTGLLCPLDDVDTFVGACRRLAGDRALYARMSEAARHDVLQRFTESRAMASYMEVYREVLDRPR